MRRAGSRSSICSSLLRGQNILWIYNDDTFFPFYVDSNPQATLAGGMVYVVTYTLENNTCAYSGTMTLGDKQYKLRGTVLFPADLNSYVLKDELSVDGKTWMPRSEEKGTKTKKSPPK